MTIIVDGECPDDDTRIIKFPHETDCNLFYKCVNGKKSLQSCGPKYLFNPLLRTCDFPENVKECGGHTPHITKAPTKRPTKGPTRGPTRGPTEHPTPIPDSCPPMGSSEKRKLPHECDCNKYYLCWNGLHVLQRCPRGLHFNRKYAACDDSEEENCASHLTSTEQTPKSPTPPVSTMCAGKKDGTRFPHRFDCSRYYECVDGRRTTRTCHKKLHFNPSLHLCDFPENVHCQPGNEISECPDTGHVKIPHETKCKLYYECFDGDKILRDCGHDFHFNPMFKVCDLPENYPCEDESASRKTTVMYDEKSHCIGDCPREDPANYTVLLPNTDCHKFCLCSNSVAYEQACPENLLYDYERKVCDYPAKVVCKVPPKVPLKADGGNENAKEEEDAKEEENAKEEEDAGKSYETSWFRLPILSRYI